MPHEIRLARDAHGRYYDANRFGDDYDWWNDHRSRAHVYTVFFSTDPKGFPDEAEEDVIARNQREAREVGRVMLAEGFDPDCKITSVRML